MFPAKSAFEAYLVERNIFLDSATPAITMPAMMGFYRDQRVAACDIDADGDMLLYQWGTHDWGDGESFEFDITRQLIFGDAEDENIWQLSLTLKYAPTDKLRALQSGNRWCESPSALDRFSSFIEASNAFAAQRDTPADAVEVDYFCAG